MEIVGLTIRVDSDDARRLAKCVVQRLTGDPEADPQQLKPDTYPIRVNVDHGGNPWAFAEDLRDECAVELGIGQPWELVTFPRPD
jgi:hypothetical protein